MWRKRCWNRATIISPVWDRPHAHTSHSSGTQLISTHFFSPHLMTRISSPVSSLELDLNTIPVTDIYCLFYWPEKTLKGLRPPSLRRFLPVKSLSQQAAISCASDTSPLFSSLKSCHTTPVLEEALRSFTSVKVLIQ